MPYLDPDWVDKVLIAFVVLGSLYGAFSEHGLKRMLGLMALVPLWQ
jgi:hypothetical protein